MYHTPESENCYLWSKIFWRYFQPVILITTNPELQSPILYPPKFLVQNCYYNFIKKIWILQEEKNVIYKSVLVDTGCADIYWRNTVHQHVVVVLFVVQEIHRIWQPGNEEEKEGGGGEGGPQQSMEMIHTFTHTIVFSALCLISVQNLKTMTFSV